MGKEIIITSLEEMCDLMCDNKIPEEPYICDTCKHKDAEWDTEPCDGCCGNHSGYECDAVSRKDIQDYIANYLSQYLYEDVRQAVEVIDAYIGDMPSVRPQTGHWIEHPEIKTSTPEYLMFYECSECGDKQCFCKSDIHKKHFCNNCGAKMESEEQTE